MKALLFCLVASATVSIPGTGAIAWSWLGGTDSSANGVYGVKGQADAANFPGSRHSHTSATDDNGDVWLFGGNGKGQSGEESLLNDLWKYSASSGWTWISGAAGTDEPGVHSGKGNYAATNVPGARRGHAMDVTHDGNICIHGGYGKDVNNESGYLADLWCFQVSLGEWAFVAGKDVKGIEPHYGTKGVSYKDDHPTYHMGIGYLHSMVATVDSNNNDVFYIFTGEYRNHLWKYAAATDEWTWVSGTSEFNQHGIYGVKGVAANENTPGARKAVVMAASADRKSFFLFGGEGYGATQGGRLNDLWKFDTTKGQNGQWIWVSGSQSVDETASYGSAGTPGKTNRPGARGLKFGLSADAQNNVWLYGGENANGLMGDFWVYNSTVSMWTFLGGSKTANAASVFGDQGVPAESNFPGSRNYLSMAQSRIDGTIYIFGGSVAGTSSTNSFWRYSASITPLAGIPSSQGDDDTTSNNSEVEIIHFTPTQTDGAGESETPGSGESPHELNEQEEESGASQLVPMLIGFIGAIITVGWLML